MAELDVTIEVVEMPDETRYQALAAALDTAQRAFLEAGFDMDLPEVVRVLQIGMLELQAALDDREPLN